MAIRPRSGFRFLCKIFGACYSVQYGFNHPVCLLPALKLWQTSAANRTYMGTWKGYHAKSAKKCIWGDYRLPFTFDFDCGDGAMIVCDKYVQNGWASFNDGSDFVVVGDKLY